MVKTRADTAAAAAAVELAEQAAVDEAPRPVARALARAERTVAETAARKAQEAAALAATREQAAAKAAIARAARKAARAADRADQAPTPWSKEHVLAFASADDLFADAISILGGMEIRGERIRVDEVANMDDIVLPSELAVEDYEPGMPITDEDNVDAILAIPASTIAPDTYPDPMPAYHKALWKCIAPNSSEVAPFVVERFSAKQLGIRTLANVRKGAIISGLSFLYVRTYRHEKLIGNTGGIEDPISDTMSFSVSIRGRRGVRGRTEWYIGGGPGRLINHDCEPNVEVVGMPEWDAVAEKRLFKVGIRALKHMEPNEELLLKYSENYFGDKNINCLCKSCTDKAQKTKLPQQTDDEIANLLVPTLPSDPQTDEDDADLLLPALPSVSWSAGNGVANNTAAVQPAAGSVDAHSPSTEDDTGTHDPDAATANDQGEPDEVDDSPAAAPTQTSTGDSEDDAPATAIHASVEDVERLIDDASPTVKAGTRRSRRLANRWGKAGADQVATGAGGVIGSRKPMDKEALSLQQAGAGGLDATTTAACSRRTVRSRVHKPASHRSASFGHPSPPRSIGNPSSSIAVGGRSTAPSTSISEGGIDLPAAASVDRDVRPRGGKRAADEGAETHSLGDDDGQAQSKSQVKKHRGCE